MSCIAIIPARGGSKRLPRKNILPLGEKPLLQWVVEVCIESQVFDEVIVSSEDPEIQKIAKLSGAKVHYRSMDIAGDRSTVVEVCLDVLDSYNCDDFCCIYATSALLTSKTLQQSRKIFLKTHEANVLMGVSKYTYSPVQALSLDKKGFATMLFPELMKIQSQFYPEIRVSNGSFYWARKPSFMDEKTFYSRKLKVFDMPEREVSDLDTREDYDTLKKLFKLREQC